MEHRERLGPYAYAWDGACFPLGQDSLLLGAFATVRRGWRGCDLGCGAGALLLLALAREPTLRLTGVERDPTAADRARRNLAGNGLDARVVTGDFRDAAVLPPAGSCDLVLSNPPYFAAGAGRPGGAGRAESATLSALCAAAGRVLRSGGRFALVHRPERLAELFRALAAHGLEPKRLQLVQHGPDAPPSAALVEAVRQGRPGLEVLPVRLSRGIASQSLAPLGEGAPAGGG